MGWKGTVRSIGTAIRAAERDAKRRQRELERQQRQYEKMQELEQAEYEVELYENHIEVIQSVHKERSERVDWKTIAVLQEPERPDNKKSREEEARNKADAYVPGVIDRIFSREEKKRKKHAEDIATAIKDDEAQYTKDLSDWNEKVRDWEKSVSLAKRLLDGDNEAKIEAIKELEPFTEISTLGSRISLISHKSGCLEAEVHIHGDDIVPREVKSLLKSGRLSVKEMPKGRFNEIYQDYVCSSVLRVANELFSTIPDDLVIVTAVDELLNSKTGHIEKAPILSACISRKTLDSLNLEKLDPSDSMGNFIHNMSFKKTKGFVAVERVIPPANRK